MNEMQKAASDARKFLGSLAGLQAILPLLDDLGSMEQALVDTTRLVEQARVDLAEIQDAGVEAKDAADKLSAAAELYATTIKDEADIKVRQIIAIGEARVEELVHVQYGTELDNLKGVNKNLAKENRRLTGDNESLAKRAQTLKTNNTGLKELLQTRKAAALAALED